MIANIPDRWVRSLANEMRTIESLDITVHLDEGLLGFHSNEGVFQLLIEEAGDSVYFSIDQLPRPQQITITLAIIDVLTMDCDYMLPEWPEA